MADTQRPIMDTPLLTAHQEAGARLVDFAGFRMPLSYAGIVAEHHSVRRAAGLFDVSHMGEVDFRGPDAVATVNRLMTNNVAALEDNQALYTPICLPDGGIVDDCLVYRFDDHHLRVVVNASNIAKDVTWFRENLGQGTCAMEDRSDEFALMALQGPRARSIFAALAGAAANEVPPFCLAQLEAAGVRCTAARTGYTGEDGFEIFCAPKDAPTLWGALLEHGESEGLKPCGLGARDTLRLEARLPLYGNDITEATTPLEAGLGWTVKLRADDFIGRQALIQQKKEGLRRKLVCLEMRARGIARQGHAIHSQPLDGETVEGPADTLGEPTGLGKRIGEVTSGTKSPTLDRAIAMGYVEKALAKADTEIVVDVRGKPVAAAVVKGPFYKRSY